MAFEADIVMIDNPYPLGIPKDQLDKYHNNIIRGIDLSLRRCGLYVNKMVTRDEYERNMKSKEFNRYIRIRNSDMESEMLKVSSNNVYEGFDQFGSSRYASCSISAYEDKTLVRCRFHPTLYRISNEFSNLLTYMGETFSLISKKDVMIFRATSTTRHGDMFKLFMEGKEKWEMSGKGILTDVKNTYGYDINKLMTNIDTNIGIFYAPIDYAYSVKILAEQKARSESFIKHIEKLRDEGREERDLIELINEFQEQNKEEISTAENRVNYIKQVLHAEPIGDILFMKLDRFQESGKKVIPNDEYEFGRKMEKRK